MLIYTAIPPSLWWTICARLPVLVPVPTSAVEEVHVVVA